MIRRRYFRGILATALVAFVSGSVVGTQIFVRDEAPTDRAVRVSFAELNTIVGEMDRDQRTTVRLLEGGSYNVNIRRIRGGETALSHPRTTDVYVVREGSGTLVTGGRIVDDQGRVVEGQRGAGITGGVEERIGVGDVVFIPAGVPHGIRETDGITWFNIRFNTGQR